MNICLVSYEFPPMTGGEGKYTFTLANALTVSGHNVIVITSDINRQTESQERYDFEIIRVPIDKFEFKLFSFDKKAKKKIKEIYINQSIDILHYTNDYMHFSISKKDINVPFISTIHHPWGAERKYFKTNVDFIGYLKYVCGKKIYYLEWLEKKICNNSDKLIAVSNYTANYIQKEYLIAPQKITVIPNSVDTKKFHPEIHGEEIREKLKILTQPIVLFVGNLDFQKGVNILVNSFANVVRYIANAKLLIVGDGPMKKDIENLIDVNGLRDSIFLAGRVSDEDLPKYYAASNLFVLPSLMEGFGIVLLEAMASGKPCITTKVGGTEEVVVNNETGFIVPPADTNSLYEAICTLLLNDNLSIKFGKKGRERVLENFSEEIMSKKTLNVYNQIL